MFRYMAYVIIGAAITGYTYYVTTVVETKPAIYTFFVVGFALITYSTYQIATTLITGGDDPTAEEPEVIPCPSCGVRHYKTSNYCHKCGAEL